MATWHSQGIAADRCRPKDVAPSPELRKWFGHHPAKWPEFRRRYFRELDAHPQAWQLILEVAAEGNQVTLIYSSHDGEHNNAVALRDYLEEKLATCRRTAEDGLTGRMIDSTQKEVSMKSFGSPVAKAGRGPKDGPDHSPDPAEIRERTLDKTIEDSFPASDPPSSDPAPEVDSFAA